MKRIISLILILTLIFSALALNSSAVSVTTDISQVDFLGLEAMLSELNAKISLCREIGIEPQSEVCKAAIIETYIGKLREDKNAGISLHTDSTLEALNKIYEEASSELDSYLAGTKTPLKTAVYNTGSVAVQGDNLIASASDGTEKKTYFVGYGHGATTVNDMEKIAAMGFNAIQMGIGPATVIRKKTVADRTGLNEDDEFSVDLSYINNTLVPALKMAEECNIAVSLLLTPHDIPSFFYEIYPDLANENTGFQRYNIYHPAVMRMLEVYIEKVVPFVSGFDSLLEICIINEPHYKSSRSSYDVPAWQNYLKEHYSDIKALNLLWKTTYKSFEEVIMPRTYVASPLMYEWVQFNDEYYSSWNAWLASLVKTQAPDVPVSAKTMSYTDEASNRIMYGVNMEDFDAFSDFNECNAWNTPYKGNTWTKLCAYDILDSIAEKPIINSEDHIINDGSEKCYDTAGMVDFANHCYADVFQGAVHGRNAVMYWAWDRSYDTSSYFYNSVGTRPLAISKMSDAALDVQRLSEEIDTLNSASDDTEVYILFSDTTRVYSRMATSFLQMAYEGAIYSGKNCKIVSDTSVCNLENGKLLIIPNCCNVPRETLKAIRNYCEAGNPVLILGECLKKDEYDNASDASDLLYLYTHAEKVGFDHISPIVEFVLRIARFFVKILAKMGITIGEDLDFDFMVTKNILGSLFSLKYGFVSGSSVATEITDILGESDVYLIDDSGNRVYSCEIRFAEYKGNMIVNICNYDWDNPLENVSVYYKGSKVEIMTELISATEIAGSVTLNPHEPLLLSFSA